MKNRWLMIAAALVVFALGVVLWSAQDSEPEGVIRPGEPVPDGATVDLQFEGETWTLSKRETTREESLRGPDRERRLPEPSPPAPDRSVGESARTLDSMARGAWLGGDPAEALSLFEKAVEADPDDWMPRAHLGRLLTLVQEHSDAREHLERAASLSPEDPQRWLDLQTLYERSLDLDLAIEARRRAEELAGGRPIEKDWAGFWTVEGADPVP